MTLIPVSRGDIFLVAEVRTEGGEIKKTRPWVVIQNDIANLHSPVVIMAAITSSVKNKNNSLDVFVASAETGLEKDGLVLCNQIRTIDKGRLIKFCGKIPPKKMELVDWDLLRSLDLDYTYDAVPPKK